MDIDTRILIRIFHIFIVGSLFLYVGINKNKIKKEMFTVLIYLGFIIILYHLYKLYGYMKENKSIWVNIIHILIIGPLLLYIGYNGEKTERKYFEILLMLGFASIGYHLYYLL